MREFMEAVIKNYTERMDFTVISKALKDLTGTSWVTQNLRFTDICKTYNYWKDEDKWTKDGLIWDNLKHGWFYKHEKRLGLVFRHAFIEEAAWKRRCGWKSDPPKELTRNFFLSELII